jgi:8-oxo-dGTP pyrophosphatase MutT (NUDIX family)
MAATPRVAAVLLPVVYTGDECRIVFTKRVRGLNHHGGEVSFPGGQMDSDDGTLEYTALRETDEEIGVAPDNIEILGTLDDELSKMGHRVTPFVGLLKSTDFTIQESEVDKVYKIPVNHLNSSNNYYCETWIRQGERRDVHFYRYENDIVWGLTARVLYRFLQIIR